MSDFNRLLKNPMDLSALLLSSAKRQLPFTGKVDHVEFMNWLRQENRKHRNRFFNRYVILGTQEPATSKYVEEDVQMKDEICEDLPISETVQYKNNTSTESKTSCKNCILVFENCKIKLLIFCLSA
jgi:hypothetical protein